RSPRTVALSSQWSAVEPARVRRGVLVSTGRCDGAAGVIAMRGVVVREPVRASADRAQRRRCGGSRVSLRRRVPLAAARPHTNQAVAPRQRARGYLTIAALIAEGR